MAVQDIVVTFTAVNLALYVALLLLAVKAVRAASNPRLRLLSWAVAAIAGVFVLGATQRLLLQESRLAFGDRTRGSVLLWGQYVLSLSALGAVALMELARRRSLADVRRVRQVMIATCDLEAAAMVTADLNATPREIDVLAAMHSGCLTDREIADELFISPATAGAHVRSLLKKSGLSRRRSLLLVALDGKKSRSQ